MVWGNSKWRFCETHFSYFNAPYRESTRLAWRKTSLGQIWCKSSDLSQNTPLHPNGVSTLRQKNRSKWVPVKFATRGYKIVTLIIWRQDMLALIQFDVLWLRHTCVCRGWGWGFGLGACFLAPPPHPPQGFMACYGPARRTLYSSNESNFYWFHLQVTFNNAVKIKFFKHCFYRLVPSNLTSFPDLFGGEKNIWKRHHGNFVA